jgi:multiple sugar transport system substrate-binding protein
MNANQRRNIVMSRRAFLKAAGLTASGAVLAACAAPATTAPTSVPAATNPPAATSAPVATSAATTAPTTVAATGGQVNFLWTDINHLRAPLIADFTAATGITVNQTILQYNDLLNKITTAVTGGGGFDVIEMDTIWTAQFASAGWIEDITSRVTPAIKSDVPDSALNAVTYQGKLYGMPWFNSCKHLFYNSKLLQDAGFSNPPATLDELVAQAQATTKAGQWGTIWSWVQSEALICDWVSLMFTQKGAQFLDASGKAVFDTMGGVEITQWMVDLLYKSKVADPASLQSTEDNVRTALFTGKYAITYNWEGTLPDGNDPTKSQAAPNVKIGLLPGSKDVKSSTVNGSEGWAMLKNAANKDNAWALLQYMASPAWQKKAAIVAGDYPILSSLYSDPDLAKNVQDFATYGEQFKYMALRPQVPGYAQKSDIIQRHLSEALLQKATPADAMKAAADEVNKLTSTP